MKRFFLLVPLCGLAGCQTWTQTQLNLVTQARRGVALVAASDASRDQAIDELEKLRRQRLDDAFDEDVRGRESIDADWVIDARKAYAAALDACAKTQAADERAAADRKRNVAAIDAALERLQWLQSIQLKYTKLEGQP
jgi:hypothetical protein